MPRDRKRDVRIPDPWVLAAELAFLSPQPEPTPERTEVPTSQHARL
jgi:hypothetical protein